MADLIKKLEETEAKAAFLRKQIRDGVCSQYGHEWTDVGGCSAGCDQQCQCSVPVRQCSKCGDMDYGQNRDAKDIVAKCQFQPTQREKTNG